MMQIRNTSWAGINLKGDGVKKNLVEAMKWFTKSADQGYAPAEGVLGAILFGGDGIATDAKQAVKWTRNAAEQGDAIAQTNLGYAYSNGIGITKIRQRTRKVAKRGKWVRFESR